MMEHVYEAPSSSKKVSFAEQIRMYAAAPSSRWCNDNHEFPSSRVSAAEVAGYSAGKYGKHRPENASIEAKEKDTSSLHFPEIPL